MTMKRDRNTKRSGSRVRRRIDDNAQDRPWIDTDAEALLGRKLAIVYSELAEQPVPDRFKDLLDQLMKDSKRE